MEIFFGQRVLQKTKSGSFILVIPPIWVRDQELVAGEKVKFFCRDGDLVVKVK
jgi:hypothetical protein